MILVLDTNVALYLLGGRLVDPLPSADYCVSIITEMELLSYPTPDPIQEEHIRDFLHGLRIIELTSEIRHAAVELRRAHGLKLPDAIIAATAIVLDAELITNDAKLLRIPRLTSRHVRIRD